jgi:uncharacterized protein (DUF302 family)
MNRSSFLIPGLFILFSCQVKSQDSFQKIKSPHSVDETVANLSKILTEKGMNIFATIDHQKGAINAGLELRPATLVIFGNPKVGTKLMLCDQKIGYDLPLKMLIWEEEDGNAWIGYWNPESLKNEYNLESCSEVLAKVKSALGNFAKAAIL